MSDAPKQSVPNRELSSLIESYCLLIQSFNPLSLEALQARINSEVSHNRQALYKALFSPEAHKWAEKRLSVSKLQAQQLPCLVKSHEGEWFLLFKRAGDQFLIKRVSKELPEQVSFAELEAIYTGYVITFKQSIKQAGIGYFDIRWFLTEIVHFKRFIPELLASAFCIQLLALMMPLVFQVITDKVIVNQATETLTVLMIALIVMTLMECLLQCSRQYVAAHTANRIDVALGKRLYDHMIRLPLLYFQSRSTGVTVMRATQLTPIREFITGAANTLVLDLFFLLAFLAVMALYSPWLAGLVALSIPLCLLVSVLITPRLQSELFTLYQATATNTAFMTEAVRGIQTVKSEALEPQVGRTFDVQTKDIVLSNFKVARLMQQQDFWIQLIQKLTLALVLWFGAKKVMSFELSIGQLIAFNMMAQHAMQPVTKLAHLWRDFVQAKISLLQIQDVLNTDAEPESAPDNNDLQIKGDITFNQVTFRFKLQHDPIVKAVSIQIEQGQSVAIIGESGSGKSTLVKLLTGLYVPESGDIEIDGQSLHAFPIAKLRQQIGVVSQDAMLFKKTIRENIALGRPSTPLSEIVEAAKQAGAHEFILQMDQGYDTVVDEGGWSLSGGQKQRLAIARALLQKPPVLVFDEATSALDEKTQHSVQQNLFNQASHCTMIMIAHRLSTIRHCDQIIVMRQGQVIERGTHEALMADNNTHYAKLWQYQRNEKL